MKNTSFFTILEKSTEENGENNGYDFYYNFVDEFIDESLIENSDSSEIGEEDFSIKPILKAIFYQNGTIEDIFYPEGVNEELKVNVKNFIEKITPILSRKNYTNNNSRLLDESDEHIFTFEKNKTEKSTKLKEKQTEKNKDFGTFAIEDSKINTNIEREITSENKIGKIISNSETNLISNVSNQIKKPNFGGLIDLEEDRTDENNIIKFPIDSISTNNSESMELIKNCKNETLKNFINNIIKNYNYISIKHEKNNEKNNLRLLSKIFNVNENEIQFLNNSNYNKRNLEKFEVLQQKIIYAYSLAKTNVAGLKFEIMVIMSFSPQNGKINFKVVGRTDKAQINVGEYNINTNYGKLITVVNQITEIFNDKILEFNSKFELKFNEWKKNISNNLKTLINNIKDPYNMIDIFSSPLSELYDNIRNISSDNFSGVKKGINLADENMIVVKEEINNGSETNTQKILNYSNSDFSNFIEKTDDLFCDFHEKVLDMISDITNKLEKVLSIDIDCYYRIIEILNEILFEYQKFSDKILSAISKNKENFVSYSNNYKENKLDVILNEIEHIAKRLNTNETLKESIKEEERIKMIKSLNNYRKTIDEMLNLIHNKINNIYSNLTDKSNINSKFNQVLNNIENKIEEFKNSQNELIINVRNFMNLTDNFEIYVKHLSLLDSIHEKCEFNRIKLMSVYFTYPISNLKDSYLNENLVKNFSENLDSLALIVINNIKNKNSVKNSLKNYENNVKNILSNIYGNNLIKNYKNIYANNTFLKNQQTLFYQNLSQFFMEFNTTFLEKNFKLEFKKYVDIPNEIFTKFSQIGNFQKNYYDNPAEKLNEIIYNSLNNLISKSYENFKNIIQNDYDIISSNVNKTNSSLVNEINNLFDSLKTLIENEKNAKKDSNYIKSTLNLSNDNPFGLKQLSLEYEDDFYTYKIDLIRNFVESMIKAHFCKNADSLNNCKIKELNSKDKHNYNMAKIRNEIEHYKTIQNYAKDLLPDELLVDLDGKKFSSLFLKNAVFSVDSVKNAILNFIKKKNDEELNIFNPYVNKFKSAYKEIFEENLNTQLITNKLEILANLTFENKIKIDISSFIELIRNKFNVFEQKWQKIQFYLHSVDLQNSYNSFEKDFKNKLLLIKNFVDDKLTLNSSVIQSTSIYYKSIFDKGHDEMLNKIFENSNQYENFILLNMTLNLSEIGKEAMKELKEIYHSHIENETERIYKKKFVELKNNIKNYIDENVNLILFTLKTEFETKYLNLSEKSNPECQQTEMRPESDANCKNRSKVQLKTLESDLINSIKNYVNTFKSQIESNFNQTQINNQIFKFENNKTQKLNQNFNFDEIENKVNENAKNLETICKENLEKEKAEFQNEINDVIENEYKKIINNFANGFGNNFMKDIYNKIYSYSLKIQFTYFKTILNNANSYVCNSLIKIIDKIELNLKDSFLNIYNSTYINIQKYSQENINQKLSIKINKLIDDSNSIISNKFSEIIINAINDKNYVSTFSNIIYNLIPKEFTYSFSLLLKKDYANIIKNTNQNYLISLFTNSINSEINSMKTILNKEEKNMVNVFASKTVSKTPAEISAILNKIEVFNTSSLIDFRNDLDFSISDNKKNYLDSFINNKIFPSINIIFVNYNNLESGKLEQIQTLLEKFPDYSQTVNKNLNSETIIKNSQNELNSLKQIIQTKTLNYLTQSFTNLDSFVTNDKTIDLTLKNVTGRRNLVEVKVNRIQSAFDIYKNDYYKMCSKLNSSNEIVNLQKEYSNFKSVLNNSVNNVGNPINNYLDIFKGFLNQTQFSYFSNKLNTQLKNIKNYVNNLINNESTIIDESLILLKKTLPELFNSNKNSFKNSIDNSLLKLYNKTMPYVNKINKNDSKNLKNVKIGAYTATLPGNVLHKFDNALKEIKNQNSVKLTYNNDYTFTVELTTKNEVYLSSSFTTNNMKGGFDGLVANISSSINCYNNFPIERVNFQAINENKGANYTNWIQYKNVRRCKRTWYTLWIGKKCWYEWGYVNKSSYKEVKSSSTRFIKDYSN